MGHIWANLEFELSQILESCSVWNQAGEGIESRQRQQQVAEKQLQLFFIGRAATLVETSDKTNLVVTNIVFRPSSWKSCCIPKPQIWFKFNRSLLRHDTELKHSYYRSIIIWRIHYVWKKTILTLVQNLFIGIVPLILEEVSLLPVILVCKYIHFTSDPC